ncbi:MAG: outer membrane protein assembly factor BamB [Gammaproteobacteria bacterium]|jgi:outer membrane protein assembly factor BamB
MRPVRRLWPLILAAGLLGGCASWLESPAGGEPAELTDLVDPLELATVWRRDLGGGSDGQQLGLRPRLAGGRLYAADHGGDILAMEAETGAVIWRVETGEPLSGGPGVGAGLVLVGTTEAEVFALDIDTGEERWRVRVTSEVLAPPAAAVDTVVVHTLDGRILGLNAADGTERWRYERSIPVLTLRGNGAPVIDGTSVYCGLAGGKVVALDLAKGVPVWEATVTVPSGRSELERLADIDGDPLVYAGVVFVATYQGDVAAVGQGTGNLLWQRELSSYSSPSADWRQVYVTDDQGFVWALDANTGSARWRQEALANRRLSGPAALLGDYVVVGDLEGYVHWLSADDGHILGRARVGSDPISAAPVAGNGVVYVLGQGGELAALRAPEPASP